MNTSDLPSESGLERYLDTAVRLILEKEDYAEFAAWSERSFWEFVPLPNELGALSDPDEQRRSAMLFTRQLWNSVPLPSNGFRPKPLREPERNAPCYCGSGLKYKQCCRKALDEAAIPLSEEVVWPIVLSRLTKEQLEEVAGSGHPPLDALVGYALDLAAEDNESEAANLLRRVFDAPIRDHGEVAGFAFDTLCNLYDALGETEQKMELIHSLFTTLPRSPLRSSVYQRMSVIFMDAGEVDEAWELFELAQQDSPGDRGLPMLEINLLLSGGETTQAQERAKFWIRTFEKMTEVDFSSEIAFLKRVAEDPDVAMMEAGRSMDDGAGIWLRDWVTQVVQRPLPRYEVQQQQMPSTPYAEEAESETMLESGDRASCESIRVQVLEPSNSLQKIERKWRKVFPIEKPFSTQDMPFGEQYAWDEQIEERWQRFLSDHPEAADSVDVLDDVLTAIRQLDQSQYQWFDRLVTEPLLKRCVDITEAALAGIACPRIPWGFPENRPALRSFARIFGAYMNLDRQEQAVAIARRLVELNPDDNHGFRVVVMNAELRAGHDEEAIALAQRYPGDMFPETAYGHALALFRAGRRDEASTSLQQAISRLPLVPKYLLRDSIRQPDIDPGHLKMGGEDQAWVYRVEMREVWAATSDALRWLKSVNKTVQ